MPRCCTSRSPIFETDIFARGQQQREIALLPVCAHAPRAISTAKAKELGCNKIALGHHFNDVMETTVMGMFYGSQMQAMLPKLHSTNFAGMELIRPLYCIHEEDIIAWKNYNELEFIQCACRFTENCTMCDGRRGRFQAAGGQDTAAPSDAATTRISKRSIFNSIHAVNLDMMPGYKTGGVLHSFLDDYDERGKKSE